MICSFFGHRDTPEYIYPVLYKTTLNLICNYNITTYYVGNHGNFDNMVIKALTDLKQLHPIQYSVVLAYLPERNNLNYNSIYPEGLELVPKKFAIIKRNKWLADASDIIISYIVNSYGGAYKITEYAKKKNIKVINLASDEPIEI